MWKILLLNGQYLSSSVLYQTRNFSIAPSLLLWKSCYFNSICCSIYKQNLQTKVKCLSPQIVENTKILFGLVFKWTHLTVFNLRNGFFFFPPQKRAINDETGQAEDSREQQHSTALATNVKIKVSVNKSLQNQDGFLPNKLHRDIWSEQQINPFSKQILQEQTLTKK